MSTPPIALLLLPQQPVAGDDAADLGLVGQAPRSVPAEDPDQRSRSERWMPECNEL